MDVATGIKHYQIYHRTLNSSPRTLEAHNYALRHLPQDLPLEALAANTLRTILISLRDEGKSQHTVDSVARCAKAWGRWLMEEEYLEKDPFARVKRPAVDDVP